MQLWIDTADIAAIKKANELGVLYGVTTNPSIFAAAKTNAKKLIEELLTIQSGFVALQVTRIQNVDEMVNQALELSQLNPARIVVKIPATPMGFAAMSKLKKHKVLVLATGISTISQFVMAAPIADYAALYLSHMQKAGKDILAEIKAMLLLAEKNKWSVNLMGAAFADAATAQAVIASGVNSVTVPEAILNDLLTIEPLVKQQLQQFENDWQNYQQHHDADLLSVKEATKEQSKKQASSWLNPPPSEANEDTTINKNPNISKFILSKL